MTVRIDRHADELLRGQAMNCTEENATLTWLLMAVHADMEMKKTQKNVGLMLGCWLKEKPVLAVHTLW